MVLELNIKPTCPYILGTIFTDDGQKKAFFKSSIDDLEKNLQEYQTKYELKDCYVSGAKSYAEGILEDLPATKFNKILNFIYV